MAVASIGHSNMEAASRKRVGENLGPTDAGAMLLEYY